MNPDYEKTKNAIRDCLQRLTKGRGAAMPPSDLVKKLQTDLRALSVALRLDFGHSDLVTSRIVRASLHGYLQRIVPRANAASRPFESVDDKERYWNAASVAFNIAVFPRPKKPDSSHLPLVDLAAMNLTERRKWMEVPEDQLKVYRPAGFDVSVSTAQRYLNDAINQMAAILADANHVRPELLVDALPKISEQEDQSANGTDSSTRRLAQEMLVHSNASGVDGRPTKRHVRKLAVALVVAVVSVIVILNFPSCMPPSTSPVVVSSVSYLRDGGAATGSWSYAFPQKLSSADVASFRGTIGDGQGYQNWALSRGGVNPKDARVQIGLRGNGGGTVVTIRDIHVTKHCKKPVTGTLLYLPAQGVEDDIGIYIDLDKQFPIAENASTHASYFGDAKGGHAITLAQGETATLLIDAVIQRQYCEFSLKLIIDAGGHEVSEMVDYHGKPFAVTAIAESDSSEPVSFSDYKAIFTGFDSLRAVDPASFNGG